MLVDEESLNRGYKYDLSEFINHGELVETNLTFSVYERRYQIYCAWWDIAYGLRELNNKQITLNNFKNIIRSKGLKTD